MVYVQVMKLVYHNHSGHFAWGDWCKVDVDNMNGTGSS